MSFVLLFATPTSMASPANCIHFHNKNYTANSDTDSLCQCQVPLGVLLQVDAASHAHFAVGQCTVRCSLVSEVLYNQSSWQPGFLLLVAYSVAVCCSNIALCSNCCIDLEKPVRLRSLQWHFVTCFQEHLEYCLLLAFRPALYGLQVVHTTMFRT